MTFFKNQEKAKSKTNKLLFTYFLTVISTAVLTSIAICLVVFWENKQIENPDFSILVVILSGFISLFIFLSSLFKIIALKKGGEYVAKIAGATPVNMKTQDPLLRKYINVTEEMSVASGTPVPKIYLMENETTINAFVAGFEMDDAVLAVSMGALKKLNRDELQGVIAHEFSHIFNGDMKLNIKLIGYLHGLSMIFQLGYIVMRSEGRGHNNSRNIGYVLPFALGLMTAGAIGMFFASLIKASISRQREFLADASALQFTRNPLGITGALKKILATDEGSLINAPKVLEVSHLFFGESIKSFSSFFATHPPLEERIIAVDPQFRLSRFIQNEKEEILNKLIAGYTSLNNSSVADFTSNFSGTNSIPVSNNINSTLNKTGDVGRKNINAGQKLIEGLPKIIKENCYDKNGATILCLALFSDKNSDIFNLQKAILEKNVDKETLGKIINIRDQTLDIKIEIRIPVVDLCSSALRSLDEFEKKEFLNLCQLMISADSKVTASEFIFMTIIEEFVWAKHTFEKKFSASELKNDCKLVMSFFALSGTKDKSKAQESFNKGYNELYREDSLILELGKDSPANIKNAFHRIRRSEIGFKKNFMSASYQITRADDVITPVEYEILRLISKILMLPTPIND